MNGKLEETLDEIVKLTCSDMVKKHKAQLKEYFDLEFNEEETERNEELMFKLSEKVASVLIKEGVNFEIIDNVMRFISFYDFMMLALLRGDTIKMIKEHEDQKWNQ